MVDCCWEDWLEGDSTTVTRKISCWEKSKCLERSDSLNGLEGKQQLTVKWMWGYKCKLLNKRSSSILLRKKPNIVCEYNHTDRPDSVYLPWYMSHSKTFQEGSLVFNIFGRMVLNLLFLTGIPQLKNQNGLVAKGLM